MQKKVGSSRCNLCGASRYYLVYKKPRRGRANVLPEAGYTISESHLEKPNKIVRCMSCGLIYALPSLLARPVEKDYEEMVDPGYVKEERGRRAQARIILSKLKTVRGGRLLDIGCGPGFFLDEAKKAGWHVQGVELSRWAQTYCQARFHIQVFRGALQEARFPDTSFDAIVMMDVLEHLEDPKGTLMEMRRILRDDGVVYISTPDIDSFLSRFLGARWWGINRYHLFYFSRKTLERMFEEVGFKRLQYFPYPRVFSLNYWAKRVEGYSFVLRTPLRALLKVGNLGACLWRVVLYDQIGVLARKARRLDTLRAEEEPSPDPSREGKKVVVVLPAYNAEKTLERTVADIPRDVVDEIILVDDASRDHTVRLAKRMGLTVYTHRRNLGYGANQKTCYEKAMAHGADIVVMVHPDYQYDPHIIPQLIEPIQAGRADAVFGSRMMKGGALEGGMPLWKHNANILLTAFENVMLSTYLTEYHSGFRAYSVQALRQIDCKANSDGFLFDTEIIVQLVANRFRIEEIPIRTRYFEEASTIRLWPSVLYGLGIIRVMVSYFFHARGWLRDRKFEKVPRDGIEPPTQGEAGKMRLGTYPKAHPP